MDYKSWCHSLVFLFLIASAAGCKRIDETASPRRANGQSILVACEGSFGIGNATITQYVPASKSVDNMIYKSINNREIGDVLQTITEIDGKLYLTVNNSDRIIVVNDKTLSFIKNIDVPKPRQILPLGDGRALVSSLYSNKMYVLDTRQNVISNTISTPFQNAEGMCMADGKVYVSFWDTSNTQLHSLDPKTLEIKPFAQLDGAAPQEVKADKEGNLWVLSGNIYKGKPAAITKLDGKTGNKLGQLDLPPNADALRLELNPTKDTIYYILVNYNGSNVNNGVYRTATSAAQLPTSPFITANPSTYFWGIGIAPSDGKIYVADPLGFTGMGLVTIYNQQGQVLDSFKAGLGPAGFYFD